MRDLIERLRDVNRRGWNDHDLAAAALEAQAAQLAEAQANYERQLACNAVIRLERDEARAEQQRMYVEGKRFEGLWRECQQAIEKHNATMAIVRNGMHSIPLPASAQGSALDITNAPAGKCVVSACPERSAGAEPNRCRHGVWLADHCWKCEAAGAYVQQSTDPEGDIK